MNEIKNRPVCGKCCGRPRAIAYTRPSGKIQYRSLCEHCLKLKKTGKLSSSKPSWQNNGYAKKMVCDICKFKAKYPAQMTVHHIDGNLNNSALTNLRTVCLNCVEVVKRTQTVWRPGDLEADR